MSFSAQPDGGRRFSLLLAFWAVAMALASGFLAFELWPLPRSVTPVTLADFSQGSGNQPVSLPDNWRSHGERPLQPGTYAIPFANSDPGEQLAVYIPSYSGQLRVAVNGAELTSGGFFSGELIADQSAPFFSPLLPGALRPGGNEITITLQPGGKLTGFLSHVYIGQADLLRPSYNWHYFRAALLPLLVVFWQLLLAVLLFVLWFGRRKERAALYCSVMMVLSSTHGIPVLLPSSLALSNAIALLGYVVNLWLSVIGFLFTVELANRALPLKARYFLAIPALATIAFLTLPTNAFHYFDLFVVVPFSLILVCWIVYILVHSAIWQRRWDSLVILISIIGACTLVVHDTLIISNVLTDSNFLHFRIVYILILPALSVVFFQRLIQSMHEVDSLVGTLEQRIEQKETELRETYEQRQRLEGKQALSDERQRIMRDMHDGLGGQLMSIIAMASDSDAKSDAIEGSARAALDDLRTMIHSIDVEDDITGVLGTFRESAEKQLALHGIELDWHMTDIPTIQGLTPSGALNVLRVLQEATTNASKHSGADNVTIRFSVLADQAETLRIDVEDNGAGYDREKADGHGLKNMARRAQSLKGSLDIDTSDQGTRVSLQFPTRFTGS